MDCVHTIHEKKPAHISFQLTRKFKIKANVIMGAANCLVLLQRGQEFTTTFLLQWFVQ